MIRRKAASQAIVGSDFRVARIWATEVAGTAGASSQARPGPLDPVLDQGLLAHAPLGVGQCVGVRETF